MLLKSDIDGDTMHIMQHNCKLEMQCKTKALNNSFSLKAFTAYPIASRQKSKNVQIPVASSKTWGIKFMQKPLIALSVLAQLVPSLEKQGISAATHSVLYKNFIIKENPQSDC